MRYRELPVPPPLDTWVECIWFLTDQAAGSEATAAQPILPDGCIELIFHFGDRFHAVGAGGAPLAQPAAFVVGLLTTPFVVGAAARVDTMAVRFRPGGAYPFFALPLSALTDRFVDLEALWGRDEAQRIWSALAAAPDQDARAGRIARTLIDRSTRVEHDRLLDAAVGAIVVSAGRARIDAVAARTGVTTRQLQRRFADRVGVSPKMLARILRFQRTLLLRASMDAEHPEWVRIAMECGYADQSHLIHDYADFAGATPASLRAAEGELSAYFTAPQRLAALVGARRYG
jgi:AraC-like DNA-binding protein